MREGRSGEEGQVLILFALGLIAFVGLVGMSVDVGRLVWARTHIQGAVDAAALAAAQSMPDGTGQAQTQATAYWNTNAGPILTQGENVSFSVTFPAGNRAVKVAAQTDIPTWFAAVLGFDHWTVRAEGTAASQVLDIAMVLDISGSMCWGDYGPVDIDSSGRPGPYVGPGATGAQIWLTQAVPANGSSTITLTVNRTDILTSTNSSTNNSRFGYNTTTQYRSYAPASGVRTGIIRIDSEVFQITGVPSATTITVTRGLLNEFTNVTTLRAAHATNTLLHLSRANCEKSAPHATSGPWNPYTDAMTQAKHFTTLFNGTYDRIGLASFSSQGTHRSDLTGTFSSVRSAIDGMIRPSGGTNSAHGLASGRILLAGAGARENSTRIVVFFTDGRANVTCGSTYSAANYNSISTCSNQTTWNDGASGANNAAISEAQRIAATGAKIYTIGFGPYVDDGFLTTIANIGGGIYYKAPTIAQLDDAFRAIAEETRVSLTQ